MSPSSGARRPSAHARFWLVQCTAWTAVAAVGFLMYGGAYRATWAAVIASSASALLGLGFTWGLRWVYEHTLHRRLGPASIALLVIGASYAVGMLWSFVIYHGMILSGLAQWHRSMPKPGWRSSIVFHVLVFGWSLCYLALRHWRERESARRDAEQSRSLARDTQLNLLRYQLNPHFVLNALNSIRSELPLENETARQMITDLADYFRYALDSRRGQFITVGEEFAGLEHYFAIERARFGDRLKIDVDLQPTAADVRIPVFLLQPLVENAIKHGRRGQTRVAIRLGAAVAGEQLEIVVANTGRWAPPADPEHRGTGVGLNNVRERLALTYPGRHEVEIREVDGWVRVCLRLPARERTGTEADISSPAGGR